MRKQPITRYRVTVLVAVAFSVSVATADAHRNVCHTQHLCPSDHATYKWKGMYCVKPSAKEITAAYSKRIRYDGHIYYCKPVRGRGRH